MDSSNGAVVPIEFTPQAPVRRMLMPVYAVEEMARVHDAIADVVDRVLTKDLDYGVIPGTGDKPVLLKPGAERLAAAFALAPSYTIVEREIDHNHVNSYDMATWVDDDPPQSNGRQDDDEINRLKAARLGRWSKRGENDRGKAIWQWQRAVTEAGESLGLYRYVVQATLVDRATAEVVGSGVGVCSTMESKYIRKPRDAENTVLKMASKRGLVAAVLNTLALSGRFTQDVEDMSGAEQRDRQRRSSRPQEAPRQQANDRPAERPAQSAGRENVNDLVHRLTEAFAKASASRSVTLYEEANTDAMASNEAGLLKGRAWERVMESKSEARDALADLLDEQDPFADPDAKADEE